MNPFFIPAYRHRLCHGSEQMFVLVGTAEQTMGRSKHHGTRLHRSSENFYCKYEYANTYTIYIVLIWKNENQSEKRKDTPAKDSIVPWSPEIPNVHRKSKESFVHCNVEQDHKLPSIDKHTTSIRINSAENHDKKDRLTHSLVIHSHWESTEAGGFQSRFLTNKQAMSSHISGSDLYAIDENSSSWLENL